MKKVYLNPAMEVCNVEVASLLLEGSPTKDTDGAKNDTGNENPADVKAFGFDEFEW